jgi:hypothetical protein
MQGICNYVPEMDHVFRVYKVSDVLWLQFMEYITLFPLLLLLLSLFITFKQGMCNYAPETNHVFRAVFLNLCETAAG